MLLIVSLFILLHFIGFTKKKRNVIQFANFELAKNISAHSRDYTKLVIRILILILIIFSLTNAVYERTTVAKNLNLVIIIDDSSSLSAREFEAIKKSSINFIQSLPSSVKLGLDTTSGKDALLSLTTNKEDIVNSIKKIEQKETEKRELKNILVSSIQAFITEEEKVIRARRSSSLTPQDIVVTTSPRTLVLLARTVEEEPTEEAIAIANSNRATIYTINLDLTNQGNIESRSLKQLAQRTGGEFFSIEKELILDQALNKIVQKTEGKVIFDLKNPLLIGIFVLLLVGWIAEYMRFGTIP